MFPSGNFYATLVRFMSPNLDNSAICSHTIISWTKYHGISVYTIATIDDL